MEIWQKANTLNCALIDLLGLPHLLNAKRIDITLWPGEMPKVVAEYEVPKKEEKNEIQNP